jgi:hypothetical protein
MVAKQKVFVQDWHGKPLMPTSPRKARELLKGGKAKIVRHGPFFTIQLIYGSSGYRQPIELNLDSGYDQVGYSAQTARKELVGGELQLLRGMSERITERRRYRRLRRGEIRHRAPRGKQQTKPKSWLAPSMEHKLDSQVRFVELVKQALPITSITVEVGTFDTQKLQNPEIQGADYQHGDQEGYWNVREYILWRDEHECQNPECPQKGKAKVLHVHHIGFWKGDCSNRPGNLITLCSVCNAPSNHVVGGWLYGWQPNTKDFRPAAFMNMVRWKLVERLGAAATYGYQTKSKRIALGLPKSHWNDAFAMSGTAEKRRAGGWRLEQIRRNNRSLEKFYDARYLDLRTGEPDTGTQLNNGRHKRNKNLSGENLRKYRAHKISPGRRQIRRRRYPWQPHDLVRFEGETDRVQGMQNKGVYVKLAGRPKPVRAEKVEPLRWRKGICVAWTTPEATEASLS